MPQWKPLGLALIVVGIIRCSCIAWLGSMSFKNEDESLQWDVDVATHSAMPPVRWSTLVPLVMLDVHRNGRPHFRTQVPQPLWLYGAHHKAGTVLMNRLALIQGRALGEPACSISNLHGPCGSFGPSCWQEPGVRLWFDCRVTDGSLERVRDQAKGALRAVHIIRDPLGLVVSGYVYHMHSNDGARLKQMRRVNVSEGVALEAKAALRDALPEMLHAYSNSRRNRDVLVVRLEEFMNSSAGFDATVQKVYEYTVGDFKDKKTIEGMVRSAAGEDLARHPMTGHGHSASLIDPDLKRDAVAALDNLPDHMKNTLLGYRKALGYA